MNALDLTGPEFLTWYLQWFALAASAFLLLRWMLRRAASAHAPPNRELDPYSIAWLKGGPKAVVRAALASLYQRKLVHLRESVVVWRAPEPATELPEIEATVFHGTRLGFGIAELKLVVADDCDEIEARLAREGLAVSRGQKAALRLIPTLGMAVCFATGVAKLMVGITRGRPVGLLVLLLLLSAAALVCAVSFIPRATVAGERLLRGMSERHAALRTTMWSSAAEQLAPNDVATAVGLWGAAALSVPMFASVFEPRKAFARDDETNGGGGASCGHSSGGHSCGGGGGDSGGGGGCGGGGCGGCGGGGS